MADSAQDDISVQAKLDSGQKRNRPERSNAKVRASIACVPCRSKHTKCDGFIPSCTRCKEEGKLCHYVSSRRGIRDPKKRNMIRDEVPMTDQDETTESTPSPNLSTSDNPFLSQDRYLSLYYTNFHVAHSWILPRRMLEPLLQTNPNDMRFLEATIAYIASQYSKADSSSLWERACEMSRGLLLPTLWNVQALLSLSVASFGEQNDSYRDLFLQARDLALNGGLQPKPCADHRKRLFMAESCRRTYWGLYVHEMLMGMREDPMHSFIYPIKSTGGTELPCEEWQYETGNFPTRIPLAEYDRLGAFDDHSSWARLVDLIRIYDSCVVQFLHGCEASSGAFEDASQPIDLWRNTIKSPKVEYVDKDGTVDMILYSALVISYGLQIQMQFHERRRIPNSEHSNPYIAHPHGSVAGEFEPLLPSIFQAPLRLVSVLNHCMPKDLSPSCIQYLYPAVELLNAEPYYKSKVDFLSSVLRKSGEYWHRSKKISDYLEGTPVGAENGSLHSAQSRTMAANASVAANTILQVDNPHWIMPPATEYWPELIPQSVRDTQHLIRWPEQSLYGSSMSYVAPATTAESFQSLDVEVGSSGEQSLHVQVETQWVRE